MSNRREIRALFVYSYGTILPSCNFEKEPVKTVLHRWCSNMIYRDGWLNFPAVPATLAIAAFRLRVTKSCAFRKHVSLAPHRDEHRHEYQSTPLHPALTVLIMSLFRLQFSYSYSNQHFQ